MNKLDKNDSYSGKVIEIFENYLEEGKDWSELFDILTGFTNFEEAEKTVCFLFQNFTEDSERCALLKHPKFIALLKTKLKDNFRKLKEKIPIQFFPEFFGFQLIFFCATKLTLIFENIFGYDVDEIIEVLNSEMQNLNLSEQIKFLAQFSEIIEKFASNKLKIANKFYNHLISVYIHFFPDFELRIFVANQILHFFKTYKGIQKDRIFEFYVICSSKNLQNFFLFEPELEMLGYIQNTAQQTLIPKILSFYQLICFTGANWQMAFFTENYLRFAELFWVQKPQNNSMFLEMWLAICDNFADLTCKGFKTKEMDKNLLILKEANHFLIFLAKLSILDFDFFHEIFQPILENSLNVITDFITAHKKILKTEILTKESYFKRGCLIFGFYYHEKFGDFLTVKNRKLVSEKSEHKLEINNSENEIISSEEKPKYALKLNQRKGLDRKLPRNLEINSIKDSANFRVNDSFSKRKESQSSSMILCKKKESTRRNISTDKSLISLIPQNNDIENKQKDNSQMLKRFNDFTQKIEADKLRKNQATENENRFFLKMQTKLNSEVEGRLQLTGKTLNVQSIYQKNTIPLSPKTKKKSHKFESVSFKYVFNFAALNENDKKAIKNNFNLHANLFYMLFKKFSYNQNSELEPIVQKLVGLKEPIMNIVNFRHFLEFISEAFNEIPPKVLPNIFKYVNLTMKKMGTTPNSINFGCFQAILEQFNYFFFNRNAFFLTPFQCFQKFLILVEKKYKVGFLFKNDFILSTKSDKSLMQFYCKKFEEDGKFQLPNCFEIVKKISYESDDISISAEKTSRKIVLSILFDVLSEKLAIFMTKNKLYKVNQVVLRQKHHFGFEQEIDCQICSVSIKKDVKNSDFDPKISQEKLSKMEDSNVIQNKSVFKEPILGKNADKLSNNFGAQISDNMNHDKLSLGIKLAILEDKNNCKKVLLEVGHCLENMLSKLAVYNSNLSLDSNTHGHIVKDIKKKEVDLENEKKMMELQTKLNKKRLDLKKKLENYHEQKSQSKKLEEEKEKENLIKAKIVSKKNQEFQKSKKLEILNAQKEKQKKELEIETQKKTLENEQKLKRMSNYRVFQANHHQKLLENFKRINLEQKANKKENTEEHNIIGLINKEKNERLKKELHSLNIQNAIVNNALIEKITCGINSEGWQEFLKKSSGKIERIFSFFQTKKETKNEGLFENRPENLMIWTFSHFHMFCADYQIFPNLISEKNLKRAFSFSIELAKGEKQFSLNTFKVFLMYEAILKKWLEKELTMDRFDVDECIIEQGPRFEIYYQENIEAVRKMAKSAHEKRN